MNCLNCGKEIGQVSGRKKKETCSSACRQAIYRSNRNTSNCNKSNRNTLIVTDEVFVLKDGKKRYVIEGGNAKIKERDKKGNLTGSKVWAYSADELASELRQRKILEYPGGGYNGKLEVW